MDICKTCEYWNSDPNVDDFKRKVAAIKNNRQGGFKELLKDMVVFL